MSKSPDVLKEGLRFCEGLTISLPIITPALNSVDYGLSRGCKRWQTALKAITLTNVVFPTVRHTKVRFS